MLPLILLALGLGAALTMYEFSPRVRERADDYARAIRGAHAAHRAADEHLSSARVTAGIQPAVAPQDLAASARAAVDEAVEHVAAARAANQVAAQSTAAAASVAATPGDRASVAQSAAEVLEREKKIAAVLTDLGVGQCGVRTYVGVGAGEKDTLLARLSAEGMSVTGSNPWSIDTRKYDVRLSAAWDPAAQVLKLIVAAGKDGYLGLVTCEEIWKKIDPIMREVLG